MERTHVWPKRSHKLPWILQAITSVMEKIAMRVPTELKSTNWRVNWDVKKTCWYPRFKKKHKSKTISDVNANFRTFMISCSTDGFGEEVILVTCPSSAVIIGEFIDFSGMSWLDAGLINAYGMTAVTAEHPKKRKRIDTFPFHPGSTWLLMPNFFTRYPEAIFPNA